MANKNHALDNKIIEAARQEFLKNDFEKASLRKIAAKADVTIGAIYTRYKTKDCLFCSLIEPLIARIKEAFSSIKENYYNDAVPVSPETLAASMEIESTAILHLLFDDYDRAVLLLCKSKGSSMEHFFDMVVEQKINETLLFFQNSDFKNMNVNVLKLLTNAQFHMYFQIINEGYELEEARSMMKSAILYHTSGWLALLDSYQRTNEQEG